MCTGMEVDKTPVMAEESRKALTMAQALCRAGLLGWMRHDLSESSRWDVHLHFRHDGNRTTGDVGLALLAGLLALAMGRSIDQHTACYGVRDSPCVSLLDHYGDRQPVVHS